MMGFQTQTLTAAIRTWPKHSTAPCVQLTHLNEFPDPGMITGKCMDVRGADPDRLAVSQSDVDTRTNR